MQMPIFLDRWRAVYRRRQRGIQTTLGLLVISCLLHCSSASSDGPALAPPLAPYLGRVVYVDFWASWCTPCARSFPWLNAMKAKYGQQLTIVGVNVDAEKSAANRFLARHPATFEVVYDPSGALAARYDIDGMPTSLILDASGSVVHRHRGFHEGQVLGYEEAIRQALHLPGGG